MAQPRADRQDLAVHAGPFDKAAYLFALTGLGVMTGSLFLDGSFGTTVILMVFVRLRPPYSSNRWLA